MADREVLRLAHAELIPWLLESGLQNRPINETIEGHCGRLVTLGVPLKRMVLGHFLLHPLYSDTDYVWDAASGETVRSFHTRDETETEAFRNDPNPAKVNLSVGVYKDDQGTTPVVMKRQP